MAPKQPPGKEVTTSAEAVASSPVVEHPITGGTLVLSEIFFVFLKANFG